MMTPKYCLKQNAVILQSIAERWESSPAHLGPQLGADVGLERRYERERQPARDHEPPQAATRSRGGGAGNAWIQGRAIAFVETCMYHESSTDSSNNFPLHPVEAVCGTLNLKGVALIAH